MRNLKRIRLILLTLLTCAIALFGASCNWFNQGDTNPPDSGFTDDVGGGNGDGDGNDDGEIHRHDWNEGVVTLEPSCESEGRTTYSCSGCDETREEPISPLGHTYAADCVCSECGTAQPVIANCVWDISKANDNSVVAKLYADTDEDYKLVVTGTGEMKDFTQNQTPWVTYAAKVKSARVDEGVTSVGNSALSNLPNLTTVSLPESLTAIGSNVFTGSDSLEFTERDGAYYLGNATNAYLVLVKIANVDITTVVMFEGSKFVLEEAFKNCANLQSVSFSPNLLGIGANAFENCVSLQEVILPDTLTQLGSSAFAGCSELVRVTILGNLTVIEVNVFINCVKLIDIYLPDTIYVIKDGAFAGCGFPSINLPSSLEQIGNNAFKDCIYLEVIVIPDKVEEIGSGAFSGSAIKEIVIPESVTVIKANVFLNCTYLVTVHIPESITVIEVDAFKGCSSLTDLIYTGSDAQWEAMNKAEGWAETQIIPVKPINANYVTLTKLSDGTYSITGSSSSLKGTVIIPDVVTVNGVDYLITQIGERAFNNRINISRIILPSTITKIGNYAFSYCSNLTNITLPESLTEIGNSAFYYCSALKEITIPENVTSIGSESFRNCAKLEKVTLPNSLKDIGATAFNSCTSLKKITIPDGVTKILGNLFSNCTSLQECTFGDQVTTIGVSAFANCSALKKIVIPESLTTIDTNAFKGAYGLEEIVFNAVNLADSNSSYPPFKDVGKDAEWLKVIISNKITKIPSYLLYSSAADEVVFESGSVCETINAYALSCGLKKLTLPSTVTTLGKGAISKLDMDSFTLPATITSVGESTFASSSMKTITVNASLTQVPAYMFYNCPNIETIVFLDGITSIGNYAFSGAGIKTITLPDTLTKIGDYAFYKSAIQTITFPASLVEIGKYAFSESALKEITVPTGVKCASYTFAYCKSLVKATLYSYAPQYGFRDCTALKTVVMGEGATSISDHAFYGCNSLTSFSLSSTMKNIYYDSFVGCNHLVEIWNLSSISITASSGSGLGSRALNVYTDLSAPSKLFYEGDYLCYKGIPDGETEERAYLIWYTGTSESVTLPEKIGGLNYDIYDYAFYSNSSIKNVVIPDTVGAIGIWAFAFDTKLETVDFGNGLNRIGLYSFKSCALTQVVLPSSVTTIEHNAFNDCKKLTKVILPNGLTTLAASVFYNCSALETIALPDSLTSLDKSLFYGCTSLKSVSLPKGITTIPENFFYNCAALEEIILANDSRLANIHSTAFSGVNVPAIEYQNGYYLGSAENPYLIFYKGVDNTTTDITFHKDTKTIASYAFENFTNLTSVTVPDHITSMGNQIFNGCSSLTSLNIPFLGLTKETSENYTYSHLGAKNVTDLTIRGGNICGSITETGTTPKYGAFYNNSVLERITFGDGVETIGKEAFSSCKNLKEVYIPTSVTKIGEYAFNGCSSLEKLTLPFAGGSQTDDYFEGKLVYIFQGKTTSTSNFLPESLKTIVILGGETLANNTFADCEYLETVQLPDTLTSIGTSAFYNCSSLKTLNIPESVTLIKTGAFHNCSSLENVYLADFDSWFNVQIEASSNSPFRLFVYAKNVYFGDELASEFDAVIPSNATEITSYQLYSFKAKSLRIPETVTTLNWAACNFMQLETLYYDIPQMASLENMDVFTYSKIGTLVFGNKVQSVPQYIFYSFNGATINLVKFEEGSICTQIGANAFGSQYADYASTINEVRLPSSLTTIGDYAFANTGLKKIYLPASLTTIASTAFYGCSNLTEVYLENFKTLDNLAQIDYAHDSSPFQGSAKIIIDGEEQTNIVLTNATKIGDYLFQENASITGVTIPATVTSIGQWAFIQTSITALLLPESVKTIGYRAFYGCKSLTSVDLGSVEVIKESAFEYCTGLTELVIPSSMQTIYCYAFRYCANLKTVTFEKTYYWNASTSPDYFYSDGYVTISDSQTAATYLTSTYVDRYFKWRANKF